MREDFTENSAIPPTDGTEREYAVAVFAASSPMFDKGHKEDAAYVGRALAERGYGLIYGGGAYGLMGIVSQAALDAGGKITGYMMACFHEEDADYPQKDFEKMCLTIADRKQQMLLASDAYIALGGGFGTLDEIIEAGIEQYMGGYANPPLPRKPIILVNRNGIYDGLLDMLDKFITEGAAQPSLKNFFIFAEDGKHAIELLETMRKAPAQTCSAVGNVVSPKP